MSERKEHHHHHHALTVRQGEKFKIDLQSNPSTGYRWHLVSFNKSILNFMSSEFVPKIASQIGSEGIERFNFEAINEGTTSIKLVYKRAWEREEATKSDEFFVDII